MRPARQVGPPVASVVVPAHNEERTIGRLLAMLTGPDATDLEILVVCNGCSDRTAEIARTYGATVIELPDPSKPEAIRQGDRAARAGTRVYLDADVEVTAAGVRCLVDRLRESAVLAAVPRRHIPRDGTSLPVRWYYDVWEALPHVDGALFGRGVIALSEAGNERVRRLSLGMSDDLAIASAFAEGESAVAADVHVVIHPPRVLADLVRRRVRVATGNTQADRTPAVAHRPRTSPAALVDVLRRHPLLVPKVPVFLAVSLLSRALAARAVRSGDFSTWHRDESSRA